MSDEVLRTERLLALRSFAGFEEVDVADAAAILGAMRERALTAGQRLARRGSPLTAAWFVVEGELLVGGALGESRVPAGETVGMLELLAEIDGLDITSAGDAVVLEVERADFMAILTGNFEMLADAMRSLCRGILFSSPLESGPVSAVQVEREAPLQLVDRLLLLHELSPLGAVGAETMADLASAFDERRVEGQLLAAGAVSQHTYLVLEGALRYGPLLVPPGGGFGALQALAELPLAHDLVAEPGTRMVVWSLDTILDALDDDIPFALSWLQGMAARAHALAVAGPQAR